MRIIFYMGVQIFEILIFYMFINIFLTIDEKRKNYIYAVGTIAVLAFTFSNTYDAFNSLIIYSHWYNVIIYILILFAFTIPYSGKWITKIFATSVYVMFSYGIEILIAFLTCLLLKIQISEISYGTMVLIVSASSLFKLTFVNILVVTKKKSIYVSDSPINVVMVMIPIVSVAVMYCMCKTFMQIDNLDMPIIVVTLLGIIYINLVMFFLFDYMNKLCIEKINATILEQEVKSSEELYQKILEGQSELRNIRHDLKNRLSGIYALLQNHNSENAIIEINDIIENVDHISDIQYSNNRLVNSILNYKLQQENGKNILVKATINLPNEIAIESGDLGVIIGNLLDNAIEACERIKDRQTFININCYMRINVIVISIENSWNLDTDLTHKGLDRINHGRGIKNVKKLVEKYQGNIERIKKDESYKVEVTVLV